MKQLNIKLILALLMSMAGLSASAHDIEVKNAQGKTIYYNYINDGTELSVTYLGTNSTSYSYEYVGNVVIPEEVTYNSKTYSVTSIGYKAFYKCSGLTSVTIPNSVTSIGQSAFYDCSGLTSIIIPNSVTSIGSWAFDGCSGLTSVTIPNSVKSIGQRAFYYCSGLKKVIVPDLAAWCSISFEDGYANPLFEADHLYSDENTEITNLVIPSSVTSIGRYAFYSCSGLTSVTIPNSVTSIGGEAFEYCKGLTSVTIGSGVKSIGYSAFGGCSGLKIVIVPDIAAWCDISFDGNLANPLYYAHHIYSDENTEITNLVIPNSVTSIGNDAFHNCSSLTSVTIGSGVTSIGSYAFYNCSGLTSVTLNCKNIGSWFNGITSIKEISFGNDVTNIYSEAFSNCTGLTTISIPDNIQIGTNSFPAKTKLYVKKSTQTLLNLWRNNYKNIYEAGTNNTLPAPYLSITSATQTTAKVKINNKYEGYIYEYGSKIIDDDTFTAEGLLPGGDAIGLTVSLANSTSTYYCSVHVETVSLHPRVTGKVLSATSLSATGIYTHGDAEIVKEVITCEGTEVEGHEISVKGLKPNTSYSVQYTITVTYGIYKYTKTYTGTETIKTKELTLTTEQPKVVSVGNVIVSATTNVDPEEKNVGVEWRRTDWSSNFASQTAPAILMDGTMEGYIRNLNADKLWKYRAYYLSDSGTYYYGDWVGIDPSNTSYFEPTVYTYSNIDVKGNSALLKGYTLGGTNKVVVQGFKYWKMANGNGNRSSAVSVPADAMTETVAIVGSGQQLMNATLKNLDYNTTYYYVAFATTENNETFYGEERVFNVDANPTRIEGVKEEVNSNEAATVVAYYDINGVRLSRPQKGINIVRMSDGTSRKIVVR